VFYLTTDRHAFVDTLWEIKCGFEIYSVSAETIINDAFSYSENV